MNQEPDIMEMALELEAKFEAMIAAAPAKPIASKPATTLHDTVKASSGWGSRYCIKTELTGEKWLATLEKAKAAVAACGIVVFLGGRGNGKTQMAAEVARACQFPNDPGEWNGHRMTFEKTALYRRAMDLFLDLRDAAKRNSDISEKDVLAKLERCGLLVIDEFQERGASDWEDRIITSLIDKRYAAQRPTILIANFTKAEMGDALSASVKDRIRENGKRFDFDWPSFREFNQTKP